MPQTTVTLFAKSLKTKPFLTAYKKQQIRRFFGKENAAFIREITQPNFQNLHAYLEHVIRIPDDESLTNLEVLAHRPVENLEALVHALSRYNISYLRNYLRKDKLAWQVWQLQAAQNGKTLDLNSLIAALHWGMLHALRTYYPDKGIAFSFWVFGSMRDFALQHISDQTGTRIIGSFLGKNSRKEYFEAKLRELTSGVLQPNPYVEKLRSAFPESF